MMISVMDALHDDRISFLLLLTGTFIKSYFTNLSYDFAS